MIEVETIDENNFAVSVSKGKGTTQHVVELDDEYHDELTGGKISKAELVRRSFEFLLDHEPKESILGEFDLRMISRYFPSYEDEIRA